MAIASEEDINFTATLDDDLQFTDELGSESINFTGDLGDK